MAETWRLLYNEEADVADLAAMPAAVAEGRIAGRFIMAARTSADTVIVQRVGRKGLLVGAEVVVDKEEAGKREIDVAVMPRSGRGSMRPGGTMSLQELMLGADEEYEAGDARDEDLAALLYTSGTTGVPKGVMLTHGNLVGECELTETIIATEEGDRFVSLVPFYHVFGLAAGCLIALFRGCASVLVPQYSPRTFLSTLATAHPTVVLAIPTQYAHVVLAARRRTVELKKPLRYCISGAAPLRPETMEEFRQRFGVGVTEGYGMTETTAAVTLNPPERTKPGSIGKPCPGVEVKIVDSHGKEVPVGETGELLIRGKTVCRGYYGMPEATREAFDSEGYLRTGDICYSDDEGYLFITDRAKDIIIKGGFNISPREVEEALTQHPAVKEAAVVGATGRRGEEEVRGFCVLAEGKTAEPTEVLAHCRKVVAAYKVPDRVDIVKNLPRSITGKVLRRELRERVGEQRQERAK
jgi:long-chain acyl-CoA synthetase